MKESANIENSKQTTWGCKTVPENIILIFIRGRQRFGQQM
jgi:hypothetical protein